MIPLSRDSTSIEGSMQLSLLVLAASSASKAVPTGDQLNELQPYNSSYNSSLYIGIFSAASAGCRFGLASDSSSV